jgi:hypothetical protein
VAQLRKSAVACTALLDLTAGTCCYCAECLFAAV